jgi:uncharacterized protein DUF4115
VNSPAHPFELGAGSNEARATERCELRVWRGYRSAAFYAVDEDEAVIATSVEFRSRGREPQETEAARQARTNLCLELEQSGWKRQAGEGEAWYAAQFVRPSETRILRPPPERQEVRAVVAVAPAAARVEDAVAVAVAPETVEPETVQPETVKPETIEPETIAPQPVAVQPAADRPAAASWPLWKQLAVWAGAFAVATAAAGAVTLGAINLRGGTKTTTTFVTIARPAATPAPSATPAKKPSPVAAPTVRRRVVRLLITATDRPSWLEIRRRSAHGAVLYSGILQPGRHLRIAGGKVWARFAAAGNLRISVDGTVVPLSGTLEKLFSAKH